mgnify:FL=1|tara:strand:- start:883 stop:1041 length:159 start_codon:yes stop_codon:yes gene_type:complete
MILTGKMFEDAMNQINEAFAQVNKKVDKLQDEVKALTQEKASGKASKGQSKG